MADISTAVEQDQIAESLLGDPSEQTQAETAEQTTGTEEAAQVETGEQGVDEQQTESQETAEEWLPSDQDKVFPDDVYARYAQRYQLTPEQAKDPLLRQLLHDKINSDILIRQQLSEQEQTEEETQVEQQEPTTQPQLTREQHFANLDRYLQTKTDPEVAKAFHSDFLRSFGVPEAEIAKTSPQQAMQFANTAAKYTLNLLNTVMPDLLQAVLPGQMNNLYPQFGDMYSSSAKAIAWESVRTSSDGFKALPAFGTNEYRTLMDQIGEKYPALMDHAQTLIDQGKFHGQAAQKVYRSVAQIAAGQKPDPATMRQAAAAGARNAKRASIRREAGNLGSGQSKSAGGAQQGANSQFQTNTDLFDEEAMSLYRSQHGRI